MCLYLAELNKMEVWYTHIGNTYSETYTYKKVYVVTGDEFGDWAGHRLIVVRALRDSLECFLKWALCTPRPRMTCGCDIRVIIMNTLLAMLMIYP